ncbi:MAG: radical SAM protein [Candidatus Aminicenantales bacterium]
MKLKLVIPKFPSMETGGVLDYTKGYAYQHKFSKFPILGAPMVAALTPKDIEISIANEEVDPIDFEEKVDLVGITSLTTQAPRAYEISDIFRRKGVKTVMGGMHASALPQEALKHTDAVCIGEAEDIWRIILRDFRKGELKGFYKSDKLCSMKNLAFPRVELLNPKAFDSLSAIQTTRGCPYQCKFCAVTEFFGGKFRVRPVEDVVKEVKHHLDAEYSHSSNALGRHIMFNDDNITGIPAYAKTLFKALIPFDIRWASQCTLTIAKDDELLNLAQKSGCRILFLGIESLSEENLSYINKRCNRVNDYKEAIKKIHDHNIMIIGSFILGLDYDDEGVFEKILNFITKNKIERVALGILTPFPGTKLYKEMEKENRIIDRDWSKYDIMNVVYRPKLMSPEKLQEGFHQSWLELGRLARKDYKNSAKKRMKKAHHIFHY